VKEFIVQRAIVHSAIILLLGLLGACSTEAFPTLGAEDVSEISKAAICKDPSAQPSTYTIQLASD
jgi:hypothetical protein